MSEHNYDTDESTFQRRSILKATGSVAGASILAGQVTGQPNGQTHLVDVGLSYDVDTTLDGDWRIEELAVNETAGYAVVDEEEVILDRRLLSEKAVAQFDGPNPVVSSKGFDAAPATLGGKEQPLLPVALDDTLRTRNSVKLTERTRQPQFTVATDREDATLTVAGEAVSVTPGKEGELRLEPEEVSVEAARLADSIEYRTVSLEAEPVVTVRNYGELDVFDVQSE